jgi:hypothetical protein
MHAKGMISISPASIEAVTGIIGQSGRAKMEIPNYKVATLRFRDN